MIEEIESILKECNVYMNKDNVVAVQMNKRSDGVYDISIYTVNGAVLECILSRKERLALIRTEPIVMK